MALGTGFKLIEVSKLSLDVGEPGLQWYNLLFGNPARLLGKKVRMNISEVMLCFYKNNYERKSRKSAGQRHPTGRNT